MGAGSGNAPAGHTVAEAIRDIGDELHEGIVGRIGIPTAHFCTLGHVRWDWMRSVRLATDPGVQGATLITPVMPSRA